MHKAEKKKLLAELVTKLAEIMPILDTRIERDGLVVEANSIRTVVPWNDILSESDTKERRSMQASAKTFIDLSSGVIHVSFEGMFIHLKIPTVKRILSAHQCALLAVLCEMEGELPFEILNGPLTKLQRHLESAIGAPLQKMALSRLKAALTAILTGSSKRRDAGLIDYSREHSVAAIGKQFTLNSIGPEKTFAVSNKAQTKELVAKLYPGCIEGVSWTVHKSGAHVEQHDLICSRDMGLKIGKILGPEVGPNYQGETLILRTASRVSVAVLAGQYERKFLNPILAAAAVKNASGMLGEIGRDLWQAQHPSP